MTRGPLLQARHVGATLFIGTALAVGTSLGACATGVDETAGPTEITNDVDSAPGTTIPEGPGDASPAVPTTPPGTDAGGSDTGSTGSLDASAPVPDSAPPVDAAPPQDASVPPVTTPDSGPVAPPDSGPPTGPTCSPVAPTSFTPAWHAQKGAKGDCYTSEIDGFWTACLDTAATQTTCSNFANGFSTGICYACLVSASTESTWGAIVTYTGFSDVNVGGCYALAGASSACSHAVQYAAECDVAYCGKTCGKTDADYASCSAAANGAGGACATYASDASTKCTGVSAAVKASCDQTSNQQASFKSLAAVFCGP